jgi:hypothetical protein
MTKPKREGIALVLGVEIIGHAIAFQEGSKDV